jgi:hypothetical protein
VSGEHVLRYRGCFIAHLWRYSSKVHLEPIGIWTEIGFLRNSSRGGGERDGRIATVLRTSPFLKFSEVLAERRISNLRSVSG